MAAMKEATIFVVDISLSMGKCHEGRDQSDLDWGMRYVWDRIASVVRILAMTCTTVTDISEVATGRKTLCQGVICVGSEGK